MKSDDDRAKRRQAQARRRARPEPEMLRRRGVRQGASVGEPAQRFDADRGDRLES